MALSYINNKEIKFGSSKPLNGVYTPGSPTREYEPLDSLGIYLNSGIPLSYGVENGRYMSMSDEFAATSQGNSYSFNQLFAAQMMLGFKLHDRFIACDTEHKIIGTEPLLHKAYLAEITEKTLDYFKIKIYEDKTRTFCIRMSSSEVPTSYVDLTNSFDENGLNLTQADRQSFLSYYRFYPLTARNPSSRFEETLGVDYYLLPSAEGLRELSGDILSKFNAFISSDGGTLTSLGNTAFAYAGDIDYVPNYRGETSEAAVSAAESARVILGQVEEMHADINQLLPEMEENLELTKQYRDEAMSTEIGTVREDLNQLKFKKVDKDGIKQITRRNTEFFVEGENLFNKNAVEDGFIANPNGLLYEHTTYKASEYIAVNAGDTLYFRGYLMNHNAFYNKNKQYVCGVNLSNAYSVVVPENVSFIRITTHASHLDACMISVTPIDKYVPYENPKIPANEVRGLEELEETAGELEETVDAVAVKNMLNSDTFTEGAYISAEGIFSESTVYSVSDYIPIHKGETLTLYDELLSEKSMRMFAAFNSNKQIIKELGSNAPVSSITQSGNMAFVRVSIQTDYVGTLMFIRVKPDRFIQYGEVIVNPNAVSIPDEVVIDAYIPDELWVAQGRTIEIYNRQVCLQHDKFHIRWIGKIGSARKRKVTINGNVSIGDYALTLEIYDDKKRKQYSKTMTVHVVDNNLTGSHAICPIGDSLTNTKKWLAEVINLSDEKISYVGTYNFSITDADGNTRTGGHEGRSGFSSRNYIEGTGYTFGSAKPEEAEHNLFWDGENSRFNWAKYKTTYGINADAVQIYLGSNELKEDNTDNVGYIKQMVDYIMRDEGVDFPIFVVNPINRATQDGLGANVTADGFAGLSGMWDYNERSMIMDLTRRLDDAFKEYTNVHMINLAITHDDEYNFGAQETPVNPRANQIEYLPTDGIHPQAQGYYQMADVMYSVYCAFLS